MTILQGTKISHLGKARNSSTQKCQRGWDILVPMRVTMISAAFQSLLTMTNNYSYVITATTMMMMIVTP